MTEDGDLEHGLMFDLPRCVRLVIYIHCLTIAILKCQYYSTAASV